MKINISLKMELIEILQAQYQTPVNELIYQSIQEFLKHNVSLIEPEKLSPEEKMLLIELKNGNFEIPLYALKEMLE